MATREGRPVLRALVAAAIGLGGYLVGRTLYESAAAALSVHGMSAGTASLLPLPIYVAAVLATVAAGSRVAAPLPWLERLAGRSRAGRHLALGFGLGAGAWAVLLLVGDATGAAREMGRLTGWGPHLLLTVVATGLLLAVISFNEELIFRVLILGALGRRLPIAVAVLASSVLFASVHLLLGPYPQYLVGLVFLGLLCCAAYLLTGTIWLSFAIHWAWDAAQTTMLLAAGGGAISVIPVRTTLALGPVGYNEGGLVSMALLLGSAVLLLALARRRPRRSLPPAG
jgi:membrane protease YdiL (CAAX protease family)